MSSLCRVFPKKSTPSHKSSVFHHIKKCLGELFTKNSEQYLLIMTKQRKCQYAISKCILGWRTDLRGRSDSHWQNKTHSRKNTYVAGVILGAIGLYKPLVDFAGAGASVPISGFGFLMSEGVRKALAQDGALGILTGGLTSAAAGISAAIVFGLIAALCTKSGDK